MCRKYQITNTCNHTRSRIFFCKKSQDELHPSCNINIVYSTRQPSPALCPECFTDWASSPDHHNDNTPQITEKSEWFEAKELWARIETINNIFKPNGGPSDASLERPFQVNRRITRTDREFLESAVVILEGYVLARNDELKCCPCHCTHVVLAIAVILHLIQYNTVFDAHNDYLAQQGQGQGEKPKLFTPLSLDGLDAENQCSICYETFNNGEQAPICFPCDTRHIICSFCGPKVLESSGLVCPMCRSEFDASKYDLEGMLKEADPEDWGIEEDIISPWWMEVFRGSATLSSRRLSV